jgi:transposase
LWDWIVLRATSEFLGHLGIVAGVFDELGLAGVVDACLPKNRVHRVDNGVVLKALILNGLGLSLVSNQHGVPLYMKALSGNSSDKKSLVETIEYVRSHLCFDERVYYVADSAFYSDENLGRVGAHTFWVSRVPGTIEEAKRLLDMDVVLSSCLDPRYRFYETTSDYGGIPQKWVLFQSFEMQGRMEKTFDKNVEKELQEAGRALSTCAVSCIIVGRTRCRRPTIGSVAFRVLSSRSWMWTLLAGERMGRRAGPGMGKNCRPGSKSKQRFA